VSILCEHPTEQVHSIARVGVACQWVRWGHLGTRPRAAGVASARGLRLPPAASATGLGLRAFVIGAPSRARPRGSSSLRPVATVTVPLGRHCQCQHPGRGCSRNSRHRPAGARPSPATGRVLPLVTGSSPQRRGQQKKQPKLRASTTETRNSMLTAVSSPPCYVSRHCASLSAT
jgi:hypothetical protein